MRAKAQVLRHSDEQVEPFDEGEPEPGAAKTATSYESFEDLYREMWAPMIRLAWLLAGRREIAEDVVHDAFVRLEPKWQQLKEPGPYLRRSVVNAVTAHHRRSEVERRHRPTAPPHVFNPEIEEVWTIVADLPARQRQALVLRFYLDLTVEQVADHLDCPVGTAKSLLHRGVGQVRERCTGEY